MNLYENSILLRANILKCVMYRIMLRGDKKVSLRRAFLFSKEFENMYMTFLVDYAIYYEDYNLLLMMSEYLKFYGMSDTAWATVVHPDGGSYVNLRNGPSQTTGTVIERVPDGSEVIILTPGKTWSKIEYDGITGYMMTRFLQK